MKKIAAVICMTLATSAWSQVYLIGDCWQPISQKTVREYFYEQKAALGNRMEVIEAPSVTPEHLMWGGTQQAAYAIRNSNIKPFHLTSNKVYCEYATDRIFGRR